MLHSIQTEEYHRPVQQMGNFDDRRWGSSVILSSTGHRAPRDRRGSHGCPALTSAWASSRAARIRRATCSTPQASGTRSRHSAVRPSAWPRSTRTYSSLVNASELRGPLRRPTGPSRPPRSCQSGRRSLTRQVLDLGLKVLVAGADGSAYPPDAWRTSGTFRSGDQSNLLVADNRTRQYELADPAERARLAAFSWGRNRK
jgi:hypothetical protein